MGLSKGISPKNRPSWWAVSFHFENDDFVFLCIKSYPFLIFKGEEESGNLKRSLSGAH